MERIAFIGENVFVYWSSIIICLAALVSIAFYGSVYLKKEGSFLALSLSVLFSVLFSIPLARLVHWYCQSGSYKSIITAMTDYRYGGYALLGVFLGCFLSAALVRILKISQNMPRMLDCMCISGGFGIGFGRLSCLFNSSDRGMVISDNIKFPFSYRLINVVSGASENRLATFMIQSFVAVAIVTALLILMIICAKRGKKIPDGDVALIFMLLYCASQIVCDSTRYDALCLRSNGFISMVQVVSLAGMLIPISVFTVRLVKTKNVKSVHILNWALIVAMFALAGYMEYFVQNNGIKALFGYSVMTVALLVAVILTLMIRSSYIRYYQNLRMHKI
jgi:prolipoprotein diacylglyceryltransferase